MSGAQVAKRSSALAVLPPAVRLVGGIVVVGTGYWLLAQLGAAVQYTGGIEAAWLPVGFAAAMLYLGDLRWFIGATVGDLVLGTGVVPFHADVLADPTTLQTITNTVEFTLAAVLMRRWLGRRSTLARPADVASVFVAFAISVAISATAGALTQVWAGDIDWGAVPSAARTWWLGDMSGGLLVAPLMIVWGSGAWRAGWQRRRVLQSGLIVAGVVALSVVVFDSTHPLTYVVFPVLILAAVTLDLRWATVAMVLSVVVAVVMTARNLGPFVESSIDDEALNTQLYILVATLTTLTLGTALTARRRAAGELAESQGREAERTAEERQRIARDLHDSVSQTLFTLGLHAGIAQHEVGRAVLPTGSALPNAIAEVAELAHGALVEMRASIFELRGDAVSDQGLVAALAAHGAALAVRHERDVTVSGPPERLPLAPAAEELLFRIGQEAVTNALKHSGSPAVTVVVSVEAGRVVLAVRDDGAGFDPARAYAGHLGLELMRARAAELGGSAAIESAPGAGTTVRVTVPATWAPATAAEPSALRAQPAGPPASVS